MRPLFAPQAVKQVDLIYLYIARDNPRAAQEVADRIYEVAEFVATYPNTGHATLIKGVRAIPANPFPYIVYFRRTRDGVRVLRVLHAARRRPGLREEGREYRADASSF